MNNTKFILLCVAVLATVSLVANQADAVLVVNSESVDQVVWGNGGSNWSGQNPDRVGFGSTTRMGNALILVFQLPTLPSGESILEADLQINVASTAGPHGGDPDFNVDAYGIRISNSPAVSTSDFFMGANDGSATKIQDNMMNWLTSSTGVQSTSDDTSVGAWIDTLYTGDTPNSTYAFIRLNADIAFADYTNGAGAQIPNRYFNINTGNSATDAPVLTITTAIASVPEPSAFAFFGFTSLAMLVFRKKSDR